MNRLLLRHSEDLSVKGFDLDKHFGFCVRMFRSSALGETQGSREAFPESDIACHLCLFRSVCQRWPTNLDLNSSFDWVCLLSKLEGHFFLLLVLKPNKKWWCIKNQMYKTRSVFAKLLISAIRYAYTVWLKSSIVEIILSRTTWNVCSLSRRMDRWLKSYSGESTNWFFFYVMYKHIFILNF